MGDKIVEGIWDCPYCDATSIGGLQKYCPNCGHPQDKDTKFRLGEKKRYLTDDEISKVGTDPDWACDYCDSLNNSKYKYCHNCGASREKDTKDYFDLHQTSNNKKQKKKDIKIEYDSDEIDSSLSRKTSHVVQYSDEHANTEECPMMQEEDTDFSERAMLENAFVIPPKNSPFNYQNVKDFTRTRSKRFDVLKQQKSLKKRKSKDDSEITQHIILDC